LLERRAEAQIAKASYLPDADIIEPAEIEGDKPIAPKKIQNYMLGLLAGFFFPLLFYRVKDMVNTTIKDKKELESMISLPILGQIFSNTRKTDQVVHAFPKSHIAESFRMIRNNLNYFLDNEKTSSIILVTSSFAQEGKSFILFNLATSMAMVNNKTIILGFDLRKPKLNDILNLKNDIGIVSFLSNQAAIQDIIIPTHIENLDVMPSGPVPPNPSELIVSEKMNELFLYLSERYKYIFIDSPPVGIISDALPLMAKADVNIFVTRQNYTPKAELPSLINSLKEKKFRHLCVVLNDVPVIKETKYGYKYYTN
jgi:capsular exopolysaccharide synthesis family protein